MLVTVPVPAVVALPLAAVVVLTMACTASSPAALSGGGPEPQSAQVAAEADASGVVVTTETLAARAREALGEHVPIEVIETWFVVVSTAPPELHRRGLGTIRRVYTALYQEYFTTPPSEPVAVYLFGDDASYRRFVRERFGYEPDTPYGFYRSDTREMVMNLATGTGTLAHELVHPLLAQDFAAVPAWFNEGFASLFEQSRSQPDGRMRGLLNWRLPGLQEALADGSAVSLEALMSTSTDAFYGAQSGLHYAMARYLCYYLQEHGQLESFYRAYRQGFGEDPTGVATLEGVVGMEVATFDGRWRAWVAALRAEGEGERGAAVAPPGG